MELSIDQVRAFVDEGLNKFHDDVMRQRVKIKLLQPFPISLNHEWSGQEVVYTAWIVCRTGCTSGAIAYACGGFAINGFPWGVVNVGYQNDSGPPSNWYKTLEECVVDSGWFE